jgi:AcrR family transcriptional regulator
MSAKKETVCPLMQAAQRLFGYEPSSHEETRWRVLQAAMEVFSEVGYHAATTRAICARAGVNLASIHYHFGDKAELYREVFRLPFLNERNAFASLDITQASLQEALHAFYNWMFPPTAQEDPMLNLFLRLYAREEGEPSGVLGDALVQAFQPNHAKMQVLLCREFEMKKPDAEVDRLAFSLVGLATIYLHGGRAVVEGLAPHLLNGKNARAVMVERQVEYAGALIAFERKRRAAISRNKK